MARSGNAGRDGQVADWCGLVGYGLDRNGGRGLEWRGAEWSDEDRFGGERRGPDWYGAAGRVMDWQRRRGMEMRGLARNGNAGEVGTGADLTGVATRARLGLARHGRDWKG